MEWIKTRGSLRGVARWLLLATLVVAPWLYGGTTAWSIELIDGLLALALVLWIASLLVDRRWPFIPRTLAIMVVIILLQGWWMVWNAHAIYDTTYRLFAALNAPWSSGAGSADYVVSLAWMLRATLLLGACCLTTEMCQRGIWLLRLWYAFAFSGWSIGLLGLIQKGTGARMIFWHPTGERPDFYTFFATFYYHANAGAFLNLALPVSAGLVLWNMARQSSPWSRSVCLTGFVLLAVAVFSNTSRMAQIVGALIIGLMAAAVARPLLQMTKRTEKKNVLIAFVIVAITIAAVAQAVRLDQSLRRWQSSVEHFSADLRWLADQTALTAVGDAGWFGFGPGTFRAVFPHYQHDVPTLVGTWRFLHQDYLQTLLEWGWLGSLPIGVLFFGAIGMGIRNYLRRAEWTARQRILLSCAVLALLGVALHAAVDFPLQIFSIQLLVVTYLGICWGSGTWGKEEGRIKKDQAFLRRSF